VGSQNVARSSDGRKRDDARSTPLKTADVARAEGRPIPRGQHAHAGRRIREWRSNRRDGANRPHTADWADGFSLKSSRQQNRAALQRALVKMQAPTSGRAWDRQARQRASSTAERQPPAARGRCRTRMLKRASRGPSRGGGEKPCSQRLEGVPAWWGSTVIGSGLG